MTVEAAPPAAETPAALTAPGGRAALTPGAGPAPGPWGAPPRTAPLPSGSALRAEVVVVGGGLSGLATAYHLLRRRPGRDVVLLEAAGLGGGATGRSTGMLTPGVGQDLPGQARRFGDDRARRAYEATLAAVRDAADLVAREGLACGLVLGGQLIAARGPGGRRRVAALAATLARLGLPHEVLDDAALEAALRLGAAAVAPGGDGPAGLRLPVAGTLDPLRLVAGLAARVVALGGRVFTDTPAAAVAPGRVALRGGGAVAAERVVVAAGAGAPGVGLQRGRVLPLVLRALVTEPLPAASLAALGWARREGVIDSRRLFDYFRLTDDDRVVFGGGRPTYRWRGRPAGDGPLAGRGLAALAADLARTFPPGLAPPVARAWEGTIDYTVDGLPVVGEDPRRPGVLHVGGWCGHGVALSLAAGRWAAGLVDGEAPPDPDLPWFRTRAPWVPFEPARWLGVRAVVAVMAAADRR